MSRSWPLNNILDKTTQLVIGEMANTRLGQEMHKMSLKDFILENKEA